MGGMWAENMNGGGSRASGQNTGGALGSRNRHPVTRTSTRLAPQRQSCFPTDENLRVSCRQLFSRVLRVKKSSWKNSELAQSVFFMLQFIFRIFVDESAQK